MMLIKRSLHIILAATLFATSCEKNVDIDIDEIAPLIVVNSVLTADSSVAVFLSRTRHILDNADITGLQGATVTISNEENQTDTLVYGEDNLYHGENIRIEEGKQYTIMANAPGFDEAHATTTIPSRIPILTLDTLSTFDDWGEKIYDFEISFEDTEGTPNYYMLSLRTRYEYRWEEEQFIFDTLYVDPEKDTIVTGYRREVIEFIDLRNETVWFNSENLAIEQWGGYESRVLFSDRLFDGKKYSLRGRFYPWFLWDASDSASIYVSLMAIDEHYYKYIDSREDHYYAKNDPFAVPVIVHNNIENGIGILGGMAIYTDSVKLPPNRWEDREPWLY